QTIALNSQLTIAKDLNIRGLGAASLTVSGKGASRVFAVSAGTTASICGLTVTKGFANQGGGIDNLGNLTLKNLVVTLNTALGNSNPTGLGGGVFNEPGATLTVCQSVFSSNQ